MLHVVVGWLENGSYWTGTVIWGRMFLDLKRGWRTGRRRLDWFMNYYQGQGLVDGGWNGR